MCVTLFFRLYKSLDILMVKLANITVNDPTSALVVKSVHDTLVLDTAFMALINKQLKHLTGKAVKTCLSIYGCVLGRGHFSCFSI